MTDRELLQQALDALEIQVQVKRVKNVIEAIRTRLAQPETLTWQNAALRLGEDLSTVGPDGYYNMNAKQWLDWALSVTTKIQQDYMQLGACEEKSRRNYIGLILGVRVDGESVIIKTKNTDNAKYLCNELLNEKEIYYYPAQPKKEWVGLTDDDVDYFVGAIYKGFDMKPRNEVEIAYFERLIKFVGAKLEDKNT